MSRWWPILLVTIVHLALAWPGAARRGVISEEIQPYLRHYPRVVEEGEGGRFAPPYDDPALLAAVDAGRPVTPRWVGTTQWPELAWHGRTRIVPVLVRGHQTALGALPGLALGPALGDGVAGVRRSSVLVGLGLVGLAAALARRLGGSRRAATVVALGCVLSPGLWFFARTGYGFELLSRLLLLATLFVAAPLAPLRTGRALATGALFSLAILCRATIAATLLPPLLLLLAHPRRRASVAGGVGRAGLLLGVAAAVPVLVYLVVRAWLPLRAAPGADLPLAALGARTAVIPAMLAAQLGWVVDPRGVLGPLVGGLSPAGGPAIAVGSVVAAAAVVRWHRGVAREPERLFVAALLGNAVFGAYLYGDPGQFQLGMALEPLFVLAIVAQLGAIATRTRGPVLAAGAALVLARAATLGSLAWAEARTDNPMLSGAAQRSLVAALAADGARPATTLTTTYDQVGVVEAWTDERVRPLHGWKALKAAGLDDAVVEGRWRKLLAAHDVCHVVLGRAANPFEGPFTDRARVDRALARAAAALGRTLTRVPVVGDGGAVVFEIVRLSGCAR